MGLKDYKKWQTKQNIIEVLSTEFGISVEDLRYLPEAIKYVKNEKAFKETTPAIENKPNQVVVNNAKEEVKAITPITPEQFVAAFAGEVEEFYEDGRRGKN